MSNEPSSYSSPIEWAILNRDVGAVRKLIEAGEPVDQHLGMGRTPAIVAATADTWDIVLLLLQNGADPAARTTRRGNSIATFARDSRVHPDSKEGRALEMVRVFLTERGLY